MLSSSPGFFRVDWCTIPEKTFKIAAIVLQGEGNRHQIQKIGRSKQKQKQLPEFYLMSKPRPPIQFLYPPSIVGQRSINKNTLILFHFQQEVDERCFNGIWKGALGFGGESFRSQYSQGFKAVIIKPLFIILIYHRKMNKVEKQEEHSLDSSPLEDEDRTKGPWSFEENLFYISFLEKNKAIMTSKKKRRQLRIFDRMAAFIRTRNPLQCRSHHQKLLEKMGDFKVIIKNFKKNVGKKYFKEQYRRCTVGPSLQLACPSVKEEQESLQTERLSPPSPEAPPAQQSQESMPFSLAEYAYLNGGNQQMMANFMVMPYYLMF